MLIGDEIHRAVVVLQKKDNESDIVVEKFKLVENDSEKSDRWVERIKSNDITVRIAKEISGIIKKYSGYRLVSVSDTIKN